MRYATIALLTSVQLAVPSLAADGIAYTDSQGRQWRQVNLTLARTWFQVAAVCPTDGVTPCTGSLGSVNVTGWVWATRQDVIELLAEWVPAIQPSGEAGGAQYTLQGLSFFDTFQESAFSCTVVGCSFGLAGWCSSTVETTGGTYGVSANVGAGYNPNYGSFTANLSAPRNEINAYRGVWMYLPGPTPPCPADLDGNGAVNPADLTILLGSWGASGKPGTIAGDLDGDGSIGGGDLTILLGAWS